MDEDSGGGPPDVRAYARYQDVDDGTETVVVDGTTIVASSSLLSTDSVRACTVMLSRDQPQVPLRKEDVEAGVTAALQTALVRPKITVIRKFHLDNRVICVRFGEQASADALIALKSVKIKNTTCLVSRYGVRPVRIQLSHIPMTATLEEVVAVVKDIGVVTRVTRPLIHGFEDHLVQVVVIPSHETNLLEEQRRVNRSATFGGQICAIQYRCLDETAICSACNQSGHVNGRRCPLAGICLSCNKAGHMRKNCSNKAPQQRRMREEPPDSARGATAFPNAHPLLPRPESIQGSDQTISAKAVAPLPPPADPESLSSTGLPPLGESTAAKDATPLPPPAKPTALNSTGVHWGDISASDINVNDISDISKRSRSPIRRERSLSPAAFSSSRASVSAARDAKINATIHNGKDISRKYKEMGRKIAARNRVPAEGPFTCLSAPTSPQRPRTTSQSEEPPKSLPQIPQFDGPASDSHSDHTEEGNPPEMVQDDEIADILGLGLDDDDSEIDNDERELQTLSLALDTSDAEKRLRQKDEAKATRQRELLKAYQQKQNDARRASRSKYLQISSMRVPPELVGHRDIDWQEYCRGLPNCCWPAQVSDFVALGMMSEDDKNPTPLTCLDCNRTWNMKASEQLDEAIFDPPHALCENKYRLVCLKGHSVCT